MQYITNAFPNAIINADAVSINPASLAILKKIGLINLVFSDYQYELEINK